MIAAHGLHKHFGRLHVLRGVDLDVSAGEMVFVIGPSGSGKSTLLRCLNRLELPDRGAITVDGTDLMDRRTDLNAVRRRIGMVFQSFNLYPHMTALGNVTLALRKVARMGRAQADAAAARPWRASDWRTAPAITRRNSPAASSSASPSPAPSPWNRG